MKKEKISELDLTNKVIDLCLWYQIEDSQRHLEFIDLKIKNYRMQINLLLSNKPLWFQKNKLKKHNKEFEELENKINQCYKEIEDEVEIIQKMHSSMTSNDQKM